MRTWGPRSCQLGRVSRRGLPRRFRVCSEWGRVSGPWSKGALSSAVLRCRRARGSPLSAGAQGDAPEDRSADPARRPSRVPARVGMPCAHGGQQCDRDPPFEQRQRSARSRGFGGARGVLESATPRGAGRRDLALVKGVKPRFSAQSEFWHPSVREIRRTPVARVLFRRLAGV